MDPIKTQRVGAADHQSVLGELVHCCIEDLQRRAVLVQIVAAAHGDMD